MSYNSENIFLNNNVNNIEPINVDTTRGGGDLEVLGGGDALRHKLVTLF